MEAGRVEDRASIARGTTIPASLEKALLRGLAAGSAFELQMPGEPTWRMGDGAVKFRVTAKSAVAESAIKSLDEIRIPEAYLAAALRHWFAALHTSATQMLVWGYFISTVVLYHGTFTVNSLAHVIGRQRFATKDDSKNSLLIAVITLGEGWHNNHHFVPSSERQGFYWWELDITSLRNESAVLVRRGMGIKKAPEHVLARVR